jgi:tetratricopeptide (TPR) repeat protein
MRSKRGAGTEKVREDIRADARAVATKFPAEAAVLAALSEAEYDAGDDDAAVAAADAALAIDPGNVNAHIQKGYALFRKARASGDETAMRTARRAFMALNKVENDHPVPLYNFYLSYASGGKEPTANAVAALEQAAELAPYADEVALALAHRRLVEGRMAEAREALMPIAYDPHGGERAGRLRMFLARLDASGGGDAAAMARALSSLADDDGKKDDDAGPGSPSGPGAPTGPGAPPGSGDASKIAVQRP